MNADTILGNNLKAMGLDEAALTLHSSADKLGEAAGEAYDFQKKSRIRKTTSKLN